MADRFPLILNTNANQIQEIASGDSLDLTGTNITNAGIITAGNVIIGAATTDLIVNGNARITGILTIGTSSLKLDGPNNLVNVGTALTLGHTQGVQFHTQNLHSAGFEVNQINASGVITATTFKGNGDFVELDVDELDVDGHTNLDNVSVAGVSTFSSNITLPNNISMFFGDGGTKIFGTAGGGSSNGIRFFTDSGGSLFIDGNHNVFVQQGNLSVDRDLDVDGHTNLDNVSVVGVSTLAHTDFSNGIDVTGDVTATGTFSINSASPLINLNDNGQNPDYSIKNSDGTFKITSSDGGGTDKIKINTDGHIDITGNLDCESGIDVTGNVNAVGNVTAVDGTFSGNVSIGGTLTYEDVINIDSVGIVTSRKGIHAGGYSAIGGSPHNYNYGRGTQGGGLSVYAAESAIEAVSTEDGNHGSSLLLRSAVDGVGFNYNPSANVLELRSFTTTANDFAIHSAGNNVSGLKDVIKAYVGSNISLFHNGVGVVTTTSTGATIDQLEFNRNFVKNPEANSRIVFHGSNETRLYHASNTQIKLAFRGNGDVFRGAVDATAGYIQLKTGADESAVVARDNGFTELYYNGSKKLNTETNGVFIAGVCTATSFSGPLKEGDSEVSVADSGSGGEVTIKADNTDVLKVIKGSGTDHVPGKVGINQFSNRKSPLTVAHSHATSPEPNLSLTCPSLTNVGGGTAIFMKSSNDITTEKRYGTLIQSIRSDEDNGSPEFVIQKENAVASQLTEQLRIDHNAHILPGSNGTQNLGSSSSKRWANIYSTALNVAGASNVATISHTGGAALTLTRSSKNISFNANYGASGTHSTIEVSTGMDLRLAINGSDKVKMDSSGNWVPHTNDNFSLGTTTLRWSNIYTNDLNLSNEGKTNDVDNTWGDYTIQEGESDLFLINNRSGKKYKFNLTEVS